MPSTARTITALSTDALGPLADVAAPADDPFVRDEPGQAGELLFGAGALMQVRPAWPGTWLNAGRPGAAPSGRRRAASRCSKPTETSTGERRSRPKHGRRDGGRRRRRAGSGWGCGRCQRRRVGESRLRRWFAERLPGRSPAPLRGPPDRAVRRRRTGAPGPGRHCAQGGLRRRGGWRREHPVRGVDAGRHRRPTAANPIRHPQPLLPRTG